MAYTITMEEIKITDGSDKKGNVLYLYGIFSELGKELGFTVDARVDSFRAILSIGFSGQFSEYISGEVEDKVAEVIAINYKYDYISKRIRAAGLEKLDRELLLLAFISGDIEEDKRYIKRRLKDMDEYALDGIFNFRLAPLKNKWKELANCIPPYFDSQNLLNFMSFYLGERRGRRAIVDSGKVYGRDNLPMNKTELTGKFEDGKIIRELILGACGKVEVRSKISDVDLRYIKTYYGKMARFTQ